MISIQDSLKSIVCEQQIMASRHSLSASLEFCATKQFILSKHIGKYAPKNLKGFDAFQKEVSIFCQLTSKR